MDYDEERVWFALECLRRYDPKETELEAVLNGYVWGQNVILDERLRDTKHFKVASAAYFAKKAIECGMPKEKALKDLLVLWPEFDYSLLEVI